MRPEEDMIVTGVRTLITRRSFKPALAVLALLAVLRVGASASEAQSGVGAASVSGVVTDETKAVIQGVTVTATNPETGVVRTAISDDLGVYRILSLQPGKYQVSFELLGFDTVKQGPLTFIGGQDTRVSAELKFASCGRL
jgi:hypothetical protein